MRKPSLTGCRPIGSLAVKEVLPQAVRLGSSSVSVEARVLAPDLFRLRFSAGARLAERPSWAVCRTNWPAVRTRTQVSADIVSLRTACGTLRLRRSDGSWELLDRRGNQAFAAAPEATGFVGKGCRLTLRLADDEALFGLGESSGTFNKRGLIREFWNIDVLGHASGILPGLRNLYVSIPFALSLRQGRAAGLFWDNPSRQVWDLGQTRVAEWRMEAASGDIDLYLFVGPRVPDIVRRYTELTGRIPLPPRWGLGYQQSRYSYRSRAELESIAATFRRRRIPCDVLYLDIDHMDGYRVFTFGKTFPAPKQMIARLARRGFKIVPIVDPGVKDDPKFPVLQRGRARDAFVKTADGRRDAIGKAWPGAVRFPDFFAEEVRRWWGDEQGRLAKFGVAGFWNDMNEPADFTPPTKTLPGDSRHRSAYGILRHADVHNVYGSQMARASREGALRHQPGRRPFIITRAGYAGLQRHALVWTGDNTSNWEQLADALQMCSNLGLSGVAFCGADVGGFMDNTTPELLARWTQFAALTPFFRNHSHIGTIQQEPWAFSRWAQSPRGKRRRRKPA